MDNSESQQSNKTQSNPPEITLTNDLEEKSIDTSTISNENENTIGSLQQRKNRVSFNFKPNASFSHFGGSNKNAVTAAQNLYNKIKSGFNSDPTADTHRRGSYYIDKKKASVSFFNKVLHLKELKHWTYMMLEKPTGNLAFIHRLFTFSLILLTILFSSFTTMGPKGERFRNILFHIEMIVTIYFFIEYLLRLWSCDCRAIHKGLKGKLKFLMRPIMVIELFAFIFGVILIIGSSHIKFADLDKNSEDPNYFGPNALMILRFVQLIRLLYVDRKAHTWIILLDVCNKHKFELMSSVYIGFITLLLSSYLIYHCEKTVNPSFHTYSDAVYWSIITMTTIGYGDISPKTFYGKMIATGLCVLGVAFWTLPGGIIGSGFAFKIEQRNKMKKFNRLLPAAAYLIQTWWRMKVIFDIPTSNTPRLVSVLKVFEQKEPQDSKYKYKKTFQNDINKKTYEENSDEREKFIKHTLQNEEDAESYDYVFRKLKPETVIQIRTLLLLRFFAAKNKFKFAHKPYDFKDVIEQYTKGNMDILVKIKELQRKLDQPPKMTQRGSLISNSPTIRRKASHIRNLSYEQPIQENRYTTTTSYNNSNIAALENRIDNIENKLDLLINLVNNNKNKNNQPENINSE